MNLLTSIKTFGVASLICSSAFCYAQKTKNMKDDAALKLDSFLKEIAPKGTMFGHQDDLAYGVGWKYEDGRSDVKEVTGEYPAVYGWDYSGLEKKDGYDNYFYDERRYLHINGNYIRIKSLSKFVKLFGDKSTLIKKYIGSIHLVSFRRISDAELVRVLRYYETI